MIQELLSQLKDLDVVLWCEESRLRYDAPKGVMTPELLAKLREYKAEILDFLQSHQPASSPAISTIPKIDRNSEIPLSLGQQRLWFLNQLEPESTAYNSFSVRRIQGNLNIEALQQSLNEIIRRHEVLRTHFKTVDGQAIQVISSALTRTLPVIDLQTLPENEQSKALQQFVTEAEQKPFDIANEALIRVTLLRLNPQEHIFLLGMHHIVTDGWSLGIFIQELSTLYQAFCAGKPSPLEELPIQYADFAVWQRELLKGKVLETQLTYWKQQLGGQLPVLNLPTDYHQDSTRQDYSGQKQSLVLSSVLTQKVQTLSQKSGVTLFMTLLATFGILLCRQSRQEDIIVGTPIAGRNPIETERLIGLFIKTLALRTNLNGNPTFTQLLSRVQKVALEAYTHQDLPFEKLVEELQPERSLNRHPIFDVMFNFNNTPQTAFELSELNITPLPELVEPESKFLMTLYAQQQDHQLHLNLVYQKALFSAERMSCFLDQYQYLLEQIVADPNRPIQSYSLLTPQSRCLLPSPEITLPAPEYELVSNQFAAWVQKTPDQAAICQGNCTWSYQQLSQTAIAITQRLVTDGIQPGQVVGICGDRSFGMMASFLAVLSMGGVLLTLDLNWPQQRFSFCLTTAQAQCLLYVGKLQPEDQWMEQFIDIIFIDAHNGLIENQTSDLNPQSFPTNFPSPEDAAYIFFTSGTSGVPKGILGSHQGLSHFLNWQRQTFNIQPQDRVAQLTGITFDVVLRDIFLPLTSGATLCLPEPSDNLSPDCIVPWLEHQQISVLHTVPTLAQSWLSHLSATVNLKSLRWVFFAGEPLSETLVYQWRNAISQHCQIVNLYGPTETTLAKCYYQIPNQIFFGVQPVGFPLPQTQVFVIKDNHQFCGIGEPGEIAIRTPFRTLGYINVSEENQKQFVKNPFRDDPQDLLYYTGDLGRYRPDGSLDILGRKDFQVKIRGIRIELEEIEAVLTQHPGVEETVVIATEYQPGDRRLIAYVVPHQEQVPSFIELRQFLKSRLPEYMIPATFVPLEALPLTPNGKLDRRALPTPNWSKNISENTYIAPRNPIEQKLAEIWAAVLWLEQPVGIHDNFFELGGHSLLSVKLVAEIEKVFKTKLSIKALFQLSTIAELAGLLEDTTEIELTQIEVKKTSTIPQLNPDIYHQLLALTAGWKGQRVTPESLIVGVNTQGNQPALFWCFQGFRELSQMAKYIGSQQPIYGMRSGHLVMEYTEENIQALVAHYIDEILRIQPQGAYRLGGNCQSGKIMFKIAQQLQRQGKTVAILCLLEAFIPKPYFGEVALFFGQESDQFNPYKAFAQPELGYRKFYRGGFSINIISGDHGQYFKEPHIQVFTKKLREILESFQTDESSILSEEAYRAQLSTVSYLTAKAGEIISVVVTVKNISSVTWLATEKSSIFLANHWLDQEQKIIQWLDGRVEFPQDLQPGEVIELCLSVTAPIELGLYHLELDLVEEGVTWFKDRKSETMTIQVEVTTKEALQQLGYLEVEENNEFSNSSIQMAEDIKDCKKGQDSFEKGDFFSAIKFYKKAIKSNPNQSFEVYFQLGKALGATGKVSDAIATYQKVIELQPDFADVYWHLGQLQSQQGQLDDAIANYKKALNIAPDLVWMYPLLAEALTQNQQLEEAISVYQKALEFQDTDSQIYSRLGHLNLKNGHLEEAYLNYQKAIELQPDSVHLYNNLGNVLLKKGDRQAAIAAAQQSIQINPKQAVAYTILGNAFSQKEEYNQAIIAYQTAIEFQTNNPIPHSYFLLGNAFRQIEDFKSAIDVYQKALTLNPKNTFGIYRNLAEAFKRNQQIKEAIAAYKKALEIQPKNPNIRRMINQLQQQ
ncbi:MAG: amino acid adenylation domain-containing protein [Microcoleaceae cyanobacterium]